MSPQICSGANDVKCQQGMHRQMMSRLTWPESFEPFALRFADFEAFRPNFFPIGLRRRVRLGV